MLSQSSPGWKSWLGPSFTRKFVADPRLHNSRTTSNNSYIRRSAPLVKLSTVKEPVERNDGPKESQEDSRQHQLAPGAGDEVWQRCV